MGEAEVRAATSILGDSGMRPSTILVTGGAGFIGGAFVRRALAGGVRVVNLDALTYAGSARTLAELEDDDGHVFVRGAIEDGELVLDLLNRHHPYAIVNFAAETHVDRSIEGPGAFVQTNLVGAYQMLEASLDYYRRLNRAMADRFRFIHVSTDEVYGSIAAGAAAENDPYAPSSPYAATKAGADHLARAYQVTFGLPTIVTNCTNNYGPRQYPEKLIPVIIKKCLAGEAIPIYGDGSNVRDWLYVDDHCEALGRVLADGRPGETYHIGGDCERDNMEVTRTICGLLDERRPRQGGGSHADLIELVEDRPGHDGRYALDTAKIRRELAWRPEVDFETGLAHTIDWYLAHPDWWSAGDGADIAVPAASRSGQAG